MLGCGSAALCLFAANLFLAFRMIQPALHDEAFLADVAAVRSSPPSDRLTMWWLGQSGFLISCRGGWLLFDPYLSDSLTKKYAATDKPHVRMTARVVDPARLDFVDVVTSTHAHTDHLDADTLRPLLAASPTAQLVLPRANVEFTAQRLGTGFRSRFVPLAEGENTTLGPFTIEAVPAAHEKLAPEFAGFVVAVGPHRIYHSGDTVLYSGMEERLRPFQITLALLPINGRAPERRVSGNLDGPEAARLAHAIGAQCVVPCHYEMFAFNTASPDSFIAECQRLRQPHAVLRAGERWEFPAL
jgi:L-ascorbate metabolism protein UlaG (beta-lactamase superfamily)